MLGRIGRAGHRLTDIALHRTDESGLFAADKGAASLADLNVKVEALAQDVFPQEAHGPGLLQGDEQMLDGQGVLGAHIDASLAGADGVGADDHPLQHRWGSPSMMLRSMKAPGSPSSPLQIMNF